MSTEENIKPDAGMAASAPAAAPGDGDKPKKKRGRPSKAELAARKAAAADTGATTVPPVTLTAAQRVPERPDPIQEAP